MFSNGFGIFSPLSLEFPVTSCSCSVDRSSFTNTMLQHPPFQAFFRYPIPLSDITADGYRIHFMHQSHCRLSMNPQPVCYLVCVQPNRHLHPTIQSRIVITRTNPQAVRCKRFLCFLSISINSCCRIIRAYLWR